VSTWQYTLVAGGTGTVTADTLDEALIAVRAIGPHAGVMLAPEPVPAPTVTMPDGTTYLMQLNPETGIPEMVPTT
jgi:hypothetical protein